MHRILIVDDHAMIRRGLQSILRTLPDWEVTAEASNGEDAVRLTHDLKPDVVLMDISMPGMSGLEATRAICKISPQTKVMLFTLHNAPEWVETALHAGARGYLLKSDPEGELEQALDVLAQDGIYTSPSLDREAVQRLVRQFTLPDRDVH
jgi:two-component system, NarL family, response regulator NreC